MRLVRRPAERGGLDPDDPLLAEDFGVDVDGCESPWHKAQFTLVYDSARVPDPPRSLGELMTWAGEHPGRFTYPAPPDFTGSVFVRQALYSVSGGSEEVPTAFDPTGVRRPDAAAVGGPARPRARPVARGLAPTPATRPPWTGSTPTARST